MIGRSARRDAAINGLWGVAAYTGTEGDLLVTGLALGTGAAVVIVSRATKNVAPWKRHAAFGAFIALVAAGFAMLKGILGGSPIDAAVGCIVAACGAGIFAVALQQRPGRGALAANQTPATG